MLATHSTCLCLAAALAYVVGSTFGPVAPNPQVKKEPGLEALPPTRLVENDADAITRLYRLRTTAVADRSALLKSIASERGDALSALRSGLDGVTKDIDGVLSGKSFATGERPPEASGSNAPESWYKGYVVDAWQPRAETSASEPRLRLRTTSGVVAPECDLRQMCERGVVLLKGLPDREMLRVVAYTPKAVSGNSDLFLITIGMATGWLPGAERPFVVLVDGIPVKHGLSENGIHVIAEFEQGRHVVEIQGATHVDREFFEFRFVRAMRL